MEVANGAVSLFFAFALILVLKFKKQLSADSKEAYTNISGGLAILALVALTRVYSGLGMLESVPFLSEGVFFEIIVWIGIITGSAFVISGVTQWLPLARQHRKFSRDRIQHLELLRKVEQLVSVESRLDAVLARTLDYMVGQFSFAYGLVFKYSAARNHLSLVAASEDFPLTPQECDEMTVDARQLEEWHQGQLDTPAAIFQSRPKRLKKPGKVIPIVVSGTPAGFFVLWSGNETLCDSDDDLTLRLVAEVIVRKIETERSALKQTALVERQRAHQDIENLLLGCRSLQDVMPKLANMLRERLGINCLATAVFSDDGQRLFRLTVGESGQMLREEGVSVPEPGSMTGPAYAANQEVVENSLDERRQPLPSDVMAGGPVGSLAAIPIVGADRALGVLTAVGAAGNLFQSSTLSILHLIAKRLEPLLTLERDRKDEERRIDSVARLSDLVTSISASATPEEACDIVARALLAETGVDMVRISTPEDEGAFLKSLCLAASDDLEGVVPSYGDLIVSLMPLHEHVLRTGEWLSAGGETDRSPISDIEAKQVFTPGLRSLCLVPILSRTGRVTGIIALGSRTVSLADTVDKAMKAHLRAVAAALAMAIGLEHMPIPSSDSVATVRPGVAAALASETSQTPGRERLRLEPLAVTPEQTADRQLRRYKAFLDAAEQEEKDRLEAVRR